MGRTARGAWLSVGAPIAVIVTVACAGPFGQTQSHGGAVTDHVSFVDNLRAAGHTVEIAGDAKQPFLRADGGTLLRISGASLSAPVDVQSFQYRDDAAAHADAESLGPDGNPKTTKISWVGPPHFFRKGRIIAIYVGSDPAALELLSKLLGPQFAGQQ